MPIEHHSLYLGQKGRILLPAQLRRKLKLTEGDQLIATVSPDGVITLVPAKLLAQRLQGCLAEHGGSVDDFIDRRKRDAAREISELE